MEEKIWHKSYAPGVKTSMDYEKTTLPEALERSAKRFPNHPALNYMGKVISYRELDALVNQFSRALLDLGVKEGEKVSLILPNIPQTIIANMAVFEIGAVVVQNNPLYSERELEHQLDDSDSKYVITLSLLIPRVKKIMPKTKVEKIIGCHINTYLPFPKKQLFPFVKKAMYKKIDPAPNVYEFGALIKKYSGEPLESRAKWDELASLIYTGGTTGVSKGVMLSHENISINIQQLINWFPDFEPGKETIVGTYPLFHAAGFTTHLFYIWMAYQHLIIPRPEPKSILELLKKYKPTILPGVPTIFVGLLNDPEFRAQDLSFIKAFFSGAAPLAEDTIKDLQDLTGATILEVYGMTETTPYAAVTPWGGKVKVGTVGIPLVDTELKAVDADGKEVSIGEPGEIAIKGPQVMMGYYKKPEETDKVLRDGWLYTGDVGVMDEDGYFKIVDRIKDMIIAGGYNIYPVEIDNTLFEHPKILEACSIGVPHEYRGETVKAFIVLKKGETLTEEEVTAFCKERLAAYKVPKIIEFLDELPKSVVGKVLRRELRDKELVKSKEGKS